MGKETVIYYPDYLGLFLERDVERLGVIVLLTDRDCRNVLLFPDDNPKPEMAEMKSGEYSYQWSPRLDGEVVLNGVSGGQKGYEVPLETILREVLEERHELLRVVYPVLMPLLTVQGRNSTTITVNGQGGVKCLVFPYLGELIKSESVLVMKLEPFRVTQLRKEKEQLFKVIPYVIRTSDGVLQNLVDVVQGGVLVPIDEVLDTRKVRVNGQEYPVRPPALAVLEQLRQIKESKVK